MKCVTKWYLQSDAHTHEASCYLQLQCIGRSFADALGRVAWEEEKKTSAVLRVCDVIDMS